MTAKLANIAMMRASKSRRTKRIMRAAHFAFCAGGDVTDEQSVIYNRLADADIIGRALRHLTPTCNTPGSGRAFPFRGDPKLANCNGKTRRTERDCMGE